MRCLGSTASLDAAWCRTYVICLACLLHKQRFAKASRWERSRSPLTQSRKIEGIFIIQVVV